MTDSLVWQHVADMLSGRHRWDTPGVLAQELDARTRQTPALDLIDAALVELANTPDGRLIISMPPQEGKSSTASINFPIWALMRNPELRIVTASYGQGLANRNGRAVRNHIKAHPELGLTIAHDKPWASTCTKLPVHPRPPLTVSSDSSIKAR